MNYNQWIADFLAAIGAPQTPQNYQFMQAWIAKESGSYPISYGWNPLNTTQSEPGSYGGGSQGNIQFFPDYQSGLNANVATITNGLYSDLLTALRAGNANPNVPYAGLNTWGTHSLAGVSGNAIASGASPAIPGTAAALAADAGGSSSSSATPSWLRNIAGIPILGPGAADLVSAGIVEVMALTLFVVGGAWLIFGNQQARSFIATTAKTASKAAEVAA